MSRLVLINIDTLVYLQEENNKLKSQLQEAELELKHMRILCSYFEQYTGGNDE